MAHEGQLLALLKNSEIAEQEAIAEKAKIDVVVEERQARLDALRLSAAELQKKLSEYDSAGRTSVVRGGELREAVSRISWAVLLRPKLSKLQAKILEQEKDLRVAVERARMANDTMIEARVEKRKVERLLERRQESSDILEAAREEQTTDEQSTSQVVSIRSRSS